MAMELGQPGLKTLYLMQILTERTDEEHALNAAEIADILEHSVVGMLGSKMTAC